VPKRRGKQVKGQRELWTGERAGPARAPGSAAPHDVLPALRAGCRVHLVGVGGIGMSAIARLLLARGCSVSGCDMEDNAITKALRLAGIETHRGHSAAHLARRTDLVVVSAAVRPTHAELREARRRGIPVMKYGQALGALMDGCDGVAVAGSHGKTTTTSMIAYAMNLAGKDPSMVIGGLVPQLGGNARMGGDGPFVVEACEYDRSFLNLRPKAAVITNIDREHMDYYAGMDELVKAFGDFAAQVRPDGLLVVNGDDPNALRAAERAAGTVETFGLGESCTWRIGEWQRAHGLTEMRIYYKNRGRGTYRLRVPALYNIRNAVACIAVCSFFGVSREDLREALAGFSGVRRRFDRLGEAEGVMVLDDYGHHPTEVQVTLDAVRKEFPRRRVVCVFQPHQCSRTRLFLNEFAQSLTSADAVIVPDIHSVRDSAADRGSVHARDLVDRLRARGVSARYTPAFGAVVDHLLTDVRDGDLVMTMGAGPVDDVGRQLLAALQRREKSDELVLRT
jgi:UDP-N-acetylmuramate--alanine ligase